MHTWSMVIVATLAFLPAVNPSGQMGDSPDQPGVSCKSILDRGFATGDGVYWVDPTGGDPADAFQAYCDMTRNGGGWTLLLKVSGNGLFHYNSTLWTDHRLLNEQSLSTEIKNAKFKSFLKVPIKELRGCFPTQEEHCIFAHLPDKTRGKKSARDWLGGFPVKLGKNHDNQRLERWSTQSECRYFGLNTPNCNQRARFGFSADQDPDCRSNDTAIGFGLGSFCDSHVRGHGAGQMCLSSGCSRGTVNQGFPGLLWAR